MLEDLNEASKSISDLDGPVLREESFGGRNEFFDDHQKWMIESFERRY